MPKRRTQIAGAWIGRPRQLVDSPAMAVLSQAAFRALNRLESEHMAHGGAENGRLPVTYAQFEKAGLHPNTIAPALRELGALGIIETTRKGYGGAAAMRAPSLYRLTYMTAWNAGRTDGTGTHEYLKFRSVADAENAAKTARGAINRSVATRAQNFSATLTICRNSPSESEGETAISRPQKVRVLPHPQKVRVPIISWEIAGNRQSAADACEEPASGIGLRPGEPQPPAGEMPRVRDWLFLNADPVSSAAVAPVTIAAVATFSEYASMEIAT
jgi:hypothetical protein